MAGVRPWFPPHPPVGVLRRFIVVPEAEACDAFGSVEADGEHVVQPWREGNQPHMCVLHGDVGTIDEPAGGDRVVRVPRAGTALQPPMDPNVRGDVCRNQMKRAARAM